MKYIKILSLMAVAAAAFMAMAGSASATIIESTAGQLGKGAVIESSGTNAVLKAGFATVECANSAVSGVVTNAGGASSTVEGDISTLDFTNCNMTVTTLKEGTLVVHHISGTKNGTLTSTGAEVKVDNHSVSCVYGTPNATDIGTITGGEPATLNASASLTKISGGFLCANTAAWTASYTVTNPTSLFVTAS
jgi:hypothetical protein